MENFYLSNGSFFVKIWQSVFFWRNLCFVFAGMIILAFFFKENLRRWLAKEQRIKHDKELFQLLNLIMPESKLHDVLDNLEKNHFYDMRSSEYIDKFRSSLNEESRQFLTPKLKKATLSLRDCLNLLRNFIESNFIAFPEPKQTDNSCLRMYPNPSIDGGGDDKKKDKSKYIEFTKKLNKLTSSARKSYNKYRSLIKQTIHI